MKVRKIERITAYVSALDITQALIDTCPNNVSHKLKTITDEFEELKYIWDQKHKFAGQGQRYTPIVDAETTMKLVNRINGPKAAAFRLRSSDNVFFQLFGGDTTVLTEIRESARRDYARLNEQNTPSTSNNANVRDGRSYPKISAERLKEIVGAVSTLIPNTVYNKCVVYLLCVGYDPITGNYIFKFGMTDDYKRRVKDHKNEFRHAIEIFVISFGMYAQRNVEGAIKSFSEVASRRIEVSVLVKNQNGDMIEKTHNEFFMCTRGEYHMLPEAIFNNICAKYSDMIESKHFHANSSPIDNTGIGRQIELAKEQAKIAEANVKIAEAPSTLIKEQARLAEANVRKKILDLIDAHPDRFDDLLKVLA